MGIKAPQRVVWSEGMLVSPQHFQQADLYHERLLDARLSALASLPWGVVTQAIDAGALGAEQVKLTRFTGVLPDGLHVSFESGDAEAPASRPLKEHFPPTQPVLDVYIGAPKERDGVPSLTTGAPGGRGTARTRYRAAGRMTSDLVGGAADLEMEFAERNVVLLFGDEPRADYDALKIAEIVRDGSGALVVNEAYIPPVLRVDASGFVMEAMRRLLALMTAKQRQLADDRKQRDPSTVEFNANDTTKFLQLYALNTAIPVLTELTRSGDMHPRAFYMSLVQIAGQLATFSTDEDPSKFPPFIYTDLRSTFEEMFARTTALLQTTARAGYIPVPLEANQGLHVGKLNDQHLQRCGLYVLAVRTELSESEVSQRLPAFCKIASYNQLPYILRAATPGIPLRHASRPPSEVPIRPGVIYFTLESQSEHWRPVLEEKTIALYLPAPFDPSRVKLELMGIPKTGG